MLPVRAAREAMAGTDPSRSPWTPTAPTSGPSTSRRSRALDDEGLLYIEQPLPPDELVGHVHLSQLLRTPICVDETLRDARAARQIAELGGPKVWNVKVHRVGGLTEVCRIWRIAERVRGDAVGGHHARVGHRLAGRDRRRRAAAVHLSVGPRAQHAVVRPERGRRQAGHGPDGRMAVPNVSIERLLDRDRFRRSTACSRSADGDQGSVRVVRVSNGYP